MKKYLLFILIITSSAAATLTAQNITVVPNPGAPDFFAWTGSGALSGYTGTPVVLGNSLVLEYNAGATSDIGQIVQQLAVYNGGNSLQLIPNPEPGQGVYFASIQTVFNNKLFFIYLAAGGVQKLASFDGTSITVYPNPDASLSGYIGSPRILNNNLYVAYQNVNNVTQFGRFNGSGISLIANPDNSTQGFFNNFSVVYNNKLVSRYVTAAGPKQLATFDGTQWAILPNPDNTPDRGVQPIFPTLYHNKLYFNYFSATLQYQLMEYNGTANPTLIANPQNAAANGGGPTNTDGMSVVYNDTLFFQYYDVNNVYRLAKFGGTAVSLVTNPDATPYGYWWKPITYNNGLYILYQTTDAVRHLAQYKPGNGTIQVFNNPDAGGYTDQPVVFGDKLYIRYYNADSKYQLCSFDGSALQLIANPPGNYSTNINDGYMGFPIVWNNKLYLQMGSVPYGHAGNLAYYTAPVAGICAGANTSFTSNVAGTSYQWQADMGSGTFTNLANAAPYSTVTTGTLTLTAPATALYGYKYRCLINGNTYSNVFTLLFTSNWLGTASTAWETAGNWSCGAVPDANTDVYISQGATNLPMLNSTRMVRSIHLQNGATMGVAANQRLTITGR